VVDRFSVKILSPKLVKKFEDGADELWAADVFVYMKGVFEREFKEIFFVESDGVSFIYGIDSESCRTEGLGSVESARQCEFIEFLRARTKAILEDPDKHSYLFRANYYACERQVTAAYVLIRETQHEIGVGYPLKGYGYKWHIA